MDDCQKTSAVRSSSLGFSKIEEQELRIQNARLEAYNKEIDMLHPELKALSKEMEEPPPQNYKIEVSFS